MVVTISTLAVAYIFLAVPLSFGHRRPTKAMPPASSRQQKLAIVVETYLLTWALLLAATIVLGRIGIAGLYWVTIWNGLVLIGSIIGLVEALVRVNHSKKTDVGPGLGQEALEEENNAAVDRRLVRGVRYEVGGTDTGASDLDGRGNVRAYEDGEGDEEGMVVETAPTEITPLMYQHRTNHAAKERSSDSDEVAWWIPQMLILVPLPVLLISQIGILLINAMSQTLVDGSSAVTGKRAPLSIQKEKDD
jgi:hypothetical protein